MLDILLIPKGDGESTRYWVYKCLLENITNLNLPPGVSLGEQETSDCLGVSRTPLRDALFQLAQEQFITIIPQSKTFVSKIRLGLVEEARYIRRCVEMDIMRKLAKTFDDEHLLMLKYNLNRQELAHRKHNSELVYALDKELHYTLFEIAGMVAIWEGVRKQQLHFQRMRNLYHTRNKDTFHVLSQHQELIAALEKRDFRLAEEIIDKHLSPEGWDISLMLDEFPDYVDAN